MSRPNGPLSPLSMNSNESFASRYGAPGGGPQGNGTPNDVPYNGGPYGGARPSPPVSQHPSSSTDMSRPSASGSSVNRPPSSASSLGRSSDGRAGFGGPPRSAGMKPDSEEILHRHYGVLKGYLAASLRDEKGNPRPNRARDKLLRLSPTQFMELSTDVFDELIRREDDRLQRVRDVPRFLPPKQNFHPKRNQARQKLSTLPIERFRQLATDVFYELERRIPRFMGGDIDRPMSSSSSASRGMRGPPGVRGPPGPGGPPFRPGGAGGPGGPMVRRPTAGSDSSSYNRPLPKAPQSNTIVPNKSTMVEDDDDEDDEDAFALDRELSDEPTSAADRQRMEAQDAEIADLKAKLERTTTGASETATMKETIEDLQGKLQEKEAEVEQSRGAHQRNGELQRQLDEQVSGAQQLHGNLQRELDQLKQSQSHGERELRTQHDEALDNLHRQIQMHQLEKEDLQNQLHGRQGGQDSADSERRIQSLQDQLTSQEKLTNQVRTEAMSYLNEMRELSKQDDIAQQREERLGARITELEKENNEWRQRYAKLRSQNKSLRASTVGLDLKTPFDSGALLRQKGLVSDDGLVKDVDVTHFQMSIDELLRAARQPESDRMLDCVKNVAVGVQAITSAVGTDGYPTPSPSPHSPRSGAQQPTSVARLKAQVTGTANSLITATKQHSSASGLSPVALLDAAASNLTSSVIELVKAVGIRPSPVTDLRDSLTPGVTANANNGTRETLDFDDMESFYDDRTSSMTSERGAHQTGNGHSGLSPSIPSLQPNSYETSPSSVDHDGAHPAPLGSKKGGWFGGWGNKSGEAEHDVPPTPGLGEIMGGVGHVDDDDDDEYSHLR